MKFAFLIHNMYGVGGTNRAVLNLATALVGRGHGVEIVSVFRRTDEPMFAIDDRIALVPLLDTRPRRPDRADPRLREPSLLVPKSEEFHTQYSRLTDERMIDYLRSTAADVIVGTRPGINMVVARHGPDHAVRVAQEHMTQDLIDDALKEEIRLSYHRIDLAFTVTEADAAAFRSGNPVPHTRVVALPNSVPQPTVPPADGTNRIVVSAGRLDPIKRYDRLIAAFARVAGDHPGWKLRIYGDGPQRPALVAQVRELGMSDQVQLMGRREDMSTEWVKGSIAAVSSERESFGMTIVEAMRLGLPVISTDCPVGPREIIQHGVDGLLVPMDDLDAYASALRTLMHDDDLRARLAQQALVNAARFDPDTLADSFARQCDAVLVERGPAPGRSSRVARSGKGPRTGRSVLARGGDLVREPDLVRLLGDPVLRGIAGSDLARRASIGALVRLSRIRQARATSARLQKAIRRRAAAPAAGPKVDCQVLPDHGLSLSIAAPGLAAGAHLLLRDRDSGHKVRVPLEARDDGARQVAVLPADELPEGRWNAYLQPLTGARLRLCPDRIDTRVLAGGHRPADDPAGGYAVRSHLPYRTADGFLAVRSWVRAEHAEVRRIALSGERVSIEAVWCGSGIPEQAVLHRRGHHECAVSVPVVRTRGGHLRIDVAVDELAAHRLGRYEDWDLWLRQAGTDRQVRLGLLVDDVVDKKLVYNYPEIYLVDDPGLDLVEEDPAPLLRVRPYYTRDSELSIVVVDRP
ncbi:glycosyltransferase involved in cell wall biosynthesis [Micromonospora vinacea]|uniref:Glycosyltransferase involved in cell wall biosynthesis n=1 Tax=Micromonospora vinacea TaxID=709878 RepID=A0ABS0K4Z9_9ACTN|nr:glycosyltransferase family 4 protein [Micromonospora vinacea]MBG6103074.1 glycosyltransferase involved in cell wall biosynthesis [Micromonospora vinacea]